MAFFIVYIYIMDNYVSLPFPLMKRQYNPDKIRVIPIFPRWIRRITYTQLKRIGGEEEGVVKI